MASAKRPGSTISGVGRRGRAPGGGLKRREAGKACCPTITDLVVLGIGNPIDPDNPLLRGFRRIHPSGVVPSGEYIEPYGFVVPNGRCLIVTDVAYTTEITKPLNAGDLTHLSLGCLKRIKGGFMQETVFVTPALYAKNRRIGGNVSLNYGIAIPHDRFLTMNLLERDLVNAHVFAYGYLANA